MSVTAEKPMHASQFHIHSLGPCPVCHVADATSWEDLLTRLEEARVIVSRTLDVESDVVLGKVREVQKI